jgi:hypothetical protein
MLVAALKAHQDQVYRNDRLLTLISNQSMQIILTAAFSRAQAWPLIMLWNKNTGWRSDFYQKLNSRIEILRQLEIYSGKYVILSQHSRLLRVGKIRQVGIQDHRAQRDVLRTGAQVRE